MKYYAYVDGARLEVDLDGRSVSIDGVSYEVDTGQDRAGVRSVLVGDTPVRVVAIREPGGRWTLSLNGVTLAAEVLDTGQDTVRAARRAAAVDAGPTPLRAPMPGLVIRVETTPGDLVEPGDGLLIVEAMKMENELKATARGKVGAVLVEEGDTVDRDQVLVEFEPEKE